EGRVDAGIEAPDHLQHQELVEVRVEQRAHDRVELPGMVVDALRDVGDRRHSLFSLVPSARSSLGMAGAKSQSHEVVRSLATKLISDMLALQGGRGCRTRGPEA